MSIAKVLVFSGAALALTGCVGGLDPRKYETPPVEVATEAGVVTCQLYTLDQVLWDRAIDIPAGMTIADGDRICKAEGLRLLER